MPLYMDIHKGVEGLTAEAVAGAYEKDLEVQEKNFYISYYGIKPQPMAERPK